MTIVHNAFDDSLLPNPGAAVVRGSDVRESLRAESASIDRLQLALGESLETFERLVWPSVRLVAMETVGLPPTVPSAGAGTALAAVLVAAARSAYHARRAMFDPDVDESDRERSERRYRVATVRYALYCNLPGVLLRHRVSDSRDEAAWAPQAESLLDFLHRCGNRTILHAADDGRGPCRELYGQVLARLERRRNALERGPGRGGAEEAFLLPGPGHRGWPLVADCARRGWHGLSAAAEAVGPASDGPCPPTTRDADCGVREEILAAVARLRSRGIWRPNTSTGRVWFGTAGIFLMWPLSGRDLCSESSHSGCTEAALMSRLAHSGLIDLAHAGAPPCARLWQISVPGRRHPFCAVRWTGPAGPLVAATQTAIALEARHRDDRDLVAANSP